MYNMSYVVRCTVSEGPSLTKIYVNEIGPDLAKAFCIRQLYFVPLQKRVPLPRVDGITPVVTYGALPTGRRRR